MYPWYRWSFSTYQYASMCRLYINGTSQAEYHKVAVEDGGTPSSQAPFRARSLWQVASWLLHPCILWLPEPILSLMQRSECDVVDLGTSRPKRNRPVPPDPHSGVDELSSSFKHHRKNHNTGRWGNCFLCLKMSEKGSEG